MSSSALSYLQSSPHHDISTASVPLDTMSQQSRKCGAECCAEYFEEDFALLTISHGKQRAAGLSSGKKLTREDAGWVSVDKDDLETKEGKNGGRDPPVFKLCPND